MKGLTVVLVLMLAGLQFRVWFGDASLGDIHDKEVRLNVLEARQTSLERRNQTLIAEVESLRVGVDAVEAQARQNLGLIRPDEQFYQVIEAVRPDTILPPAVDPNRSSPFSVDE
ncbi:MAG: septum formation initiator family protein [Halothiobacillaceae bacterium]|nr:septum formation initiator family protein [Halothiobacillaceae bacterium]